MRMVIYQTGGMFQPVGIVLSYDIISELCFSVMTRLICLTFPLPSLFFIIVITMFLSYGVCVCVCGMNTSK